MRFVVLWLILSQPEIESKRKLLLALVFWAWWLTVGAMCVPINPEVKVCAVLTQSWACQVSGPTVLYDPWEHPYPSDSRLPVFALPWPRSQSSQDRTRGKPVMLQLCQGKSDFVHSWPGDGMGHFLTQNASKFTSTHGDRSVSQKEATFLLTMWEHRVSQELNSSTQRRLDYFAYGLV